MTLPLRAPLPTGVCVLGLGLIGGSLLRAAGEHLPVTGWSPSEDTRDAAAEAGFEVHKDLETALRWAESTDSLVMLASPTTAFESLLRSMARYAPELLVSDVGGVKSPITQQVSTILPRARFVGGHPMAGTAESGFAAANAALFEQAAWVTTLDDGTHLEAWDVVAGLALALGSRVVPCTAADHDAAVARVSHLPHLLALALAQVGANGGPLALSLAAGSFADGTRVAGTRPELIRAMLEGNLEAVIDATDDALGFLGVARGSLASTGAAKAATDAGTDAREVFDRRQEELAEMTLTDPTIADLLAVGTSGGHVTGLESDGERRVVSGFAG